jgi:hypothetical protein
MEPVHIDGLILFWSLPEKLFLTVTGNLIYTLGWLKLNTVDFPSKTKKGFYYELSELNILNFKIINEWIKIIY